MVLEGIDRNMGANLEELKLANYPRFVEKIALFID